jgi:predicted nucleic acid-binding Zn ribbon protein
MDQPVPLGSVLEEAMRASKIDVDLDVYRLWEEWTHLVGPAIAQNASPEAIKGKLLLVNVSSSPWMQQLQYLKSELMEKLNTALGRNAVEDIRFKIGPVK